MKRYRRTTLIAVGCLGVLAGLGLAWRVSFAPQLWLLALTPLLLFIKKRNVVTLYLIILIGLGLGLWRGSAYMHKLSVLESYTGQKITVQGIVLADSVYGKNS